MASFLPSPLNLRSIFPRATVREMEMIMAEMVERVARAICKSERGNPDYVGPGADPNFPAWTKYQLKARACILAMREPTETMFCAGDEHIIDALNDHGGVRRDPTPAQGAWNAMIDAALGHNARFVASILQADDGPAEAKFTSIDDMMQYLEN